MARAPHRLKRRFYHHRYAAVPMECRGVVGEYDRRTDSATIWSSTQVVHWVRREVAATLGLPEARVRCIALDVGGGFGGKGHAYPEDLLLPFLARRLGRPVRWIEDRREHLMCAGHSRDQLHDVEIGFDDDGRILAIRDDYIVDCGAWNPIGSGVAYNTAVHLTGPYKIEHLAVRPRSSPPTRCRTRPIAAPAARKPCFAMERSIDLVARTLGLEPAEVRRRNMIRADEMPYRVRHAVPRRRADRLRQRRLPGALDKALDAVGGVEAFRARQARRGARAAISVSASAAISRAPASARSRARPSASTPTARSTSRPAPARRARAWRRSSRRSSPTRGRSRPTMSSCRSPTRRRSRSASARWPAAARSRSRPRSTTPASGCAKRSSRSPPICWNAPRPISSCATAASAWSACRAPRSTLAEVAQAARPGWDHGRPPGVDAGLEETYYWEPPTVTWSYAVHAAIVEVDVELGHDAAVQSKLLGAEEVTICYRRGQDQMNASEYEQELATANGVVIRHWLQPKRVIVKGGKVTGIELEYTAMAGDELAGTGETMTLAADQVFKAIGQSFEDGALNGSGASIAIDSGRIKVDAEGRTSLAKVWAGGDCILGGDDLTVSAVAQGRDAAESIHRTLAANGRA